MVIKKIAFLRSITIILMVGNICTISLLSAPGRASKHHAHHFIDITLTKLQNDLLVIKIYVTKKVADDLKKAKKWGKGMAKTFAGISSYTFDAFPFEFYTVPKAIDNVFKLLATDKSVEYIQEAKEEYKRTLSDGKRKVNQNKLGEFLYRRVVARVTVTPEQRATLERDPLMMDEFVRKGIVKKDEYMYFTLLNFVVRYYLEQEAKRR